MTTPMTIRGNSFDIPILASGKDWLVVDKPAGITVHNAPGQDVCSLTSEYIRKESSVPGLEGMGPDTGVSPVHRLDKEASGILLLATTVEAFHFLSRQFESRQVRKRYAAILHGMLAGIEGDDPWGTWG